MMPKHDWQETLKAAHDEPIDAAHYGAVRARVLGEIERTRIRRRRLSWLWGAAAVAASLLAWVVPVQRPELPPLRTVASAIPRAPAVPVASVPAVRPVRVRTRAHREPLTIKLQTSDPNIVIYWIAD